MFRVFRLFWVVFPLFLTCPALPGSAAHEALLLDPRLVAGALDVPEVLVLVQGRRQRLVQRRGSIKSTRTTEEGRLSV